MKTVWFGLLLLGLACSREPLTDIGSAFQSGDLARAESLLEEATAKKPQWVEGRAARFVLFRHLAVQGDASRQALYQQRSIEEYDWLIKKFGISAEYADMENSLARSPAAAAVLEAARKPLYGQ